MAGVASAPRAAAVSASPVGRLARAQYAALAAMRWKRFTTSLRSFRGAAELGARIVVGIIFGSMGLGAAFGLGAGAYAIVSGNKWPLLPVVFWVVFFIWQILPITLASFQEQYEFGDLLRFPVSFGTFCVLNVIFGLVDAPTLMGGLCCAGIGLGIVVAAPGLWVWTAVVLIAFAVFNLFLSRAVFAWIERWLAQRRTREIVSVVFLMLVLGMNFFNPAFRKSAGQPAISAQTRESALRNLQTVDAVQRWLPPGLAAEGLRSGARGATGEAVTRLGLLGIGVCLAGAVLALRLRAEFRGENLGAAPGRDKAEASVGKPLLDGSGPISAVVEKEIRTIARALNLLYALGAPLIFVFVLAGIFQTRASGHVGWGLLICLAYAFAGFTMLIYNNLGAEGPGIQILFLSPTPMRRVILAKNLFHALLFAVDAILVCLIASLRYGRPSADSLAATIGWLVFALPVHLAAGNALSLLMPYRLNLGRIGRQKGSQANALLSLGVQLVVFGVGAGVFALCSRAGRLWWATPIFAALAAVTWTLWMVTLPSIERMAYRRRERLLELLVRAD